MFKDSTLCISIDFFTTDSAYITYQKVYFVEKTWDDFFVDLVATI